VPPFQRVDQGPADGPGSIVDEHVDGPDLFDQLVDPGQVGEVGRYGGGVAACGVDAADDFGEEILPARDRDHRRTLCSESLRGDRTDARRRAGQQNSLASQVNRRAGGPSGHRAHSCQPQRLADVRDHGQHLCSHRHRGGRLGLSI
jgi:hypothetical protein